jgi:protein-tyrosine phosphatase
MLFYEKYNELFGIVDNELKIKTDDYKSFEEFKNERIKRFSLLSNNKKKQIYNLQWIVLNKVNTDLKFQKFKKLVSKIEDKLEDIEKNYTIKEFLD